MLKPRLITVWLSASLMLAGCYAQARTEEGAPVTRSYDRCLTIAHRGGSRYAPENTIPAFLSAFEQGADAVELDVRVSADAQLVVMHDATVERTTNGHGAVRDLTLAQLKRLDAGAWFAPRFAGVTIPTLSEALQAIRGRGKVLVEIKSAEPSLVPALVAYCIRTQHMRDAASIISFHTEALDALQSAWPDAPLGQLVFPNSDGLNTVWPASYHLALGFAGRLELGTVRALHRQGRTVYAWTVNTESEMLRLMAADVDGIITDDPALHLRLRRQIRASNAS